MEKKILIINANYYKKICKYLLEGAVECIERDGGGLLYEMVEAPGAFEIPGVLNLAIKSDKYDGYIILGCVIKGETDHYDFICQSVMNSILSLINDHDIACGVGLLTVNNEAQAMERADRNKKNNGGHAAMACLEMMKVRNLYKVLNK
jgi:6,7-dimethyl-8-ribityllumazine synthase